MRLSRRVLAMAAVLLATHVAQAGEYKAPEGFSFTVPKNWVITTKDETNGLVNQANSRMRTSAPVGAEKLAVFAYDSSKPEFMQNMSVEVAPARIIADKAELDRHKAQVENYFRSTGFRVVSISAALITVADRDALSIHVVSNYPGVSFPIETWQIAVPGGDKTYIIAFSTLEEEFPAAEGEFNQILSSFSAPRGLPLPKWTLCGLAGAAIGGVFALIAWLIHKKKKAAAGYGQPLAVEAGSLSAPQPWTPPHAPYQQAASPPPPPPVMKPAASGPAALDPAALGPPPTAPANDFIRFSCTCGKQLKISRAYSGKQCQCPACKAAVRIP